MLKCFNCIKTRALQLGLDASVYGFVSRIKSSILFEINGECINSQCDMYYGFGDGDRYFTVGVAFDGGLGLPALHDLWIYPLCGQAMSIGDVATIINNNTIDRSSNINYRNTLNAALSNNETAWNVWRSSLEIDFPITIEVINDDRNGNVEVLFTNHGGSIQSCSFTDSFSPNKDLYFDAINDRKNQPEAQKIYDIAITTSSTSFVTVTLDANTMDPFISIDIASSTIVDPTVPKWTLEDANTPSTWYVVHIHIFECHI